MSNKLITSLPEFIKQDGKLQSILSKYLSSKIHSTKTKSPHYYFVLPNGKYLSFKKCTTIKNSNDNSKKIKFNLTTHSANNIKKPIIDFLVLYDDSTDYDVVFWFVKTKHNNKYLTMTHRQLNTYYRFEYEYLESFLKETYNSHIKNHNVLLLNNQNDEDTILDDSLLVDQTIRLRHNNVSLTSTNNSSFLLKLNNEYFNITKEDFQSLVKICEYYNSNF